MAITGEKIFTHSIAIVDELLDTGLLSEDDTANYRAKAPFLINLAQAELSKIGELFNTYEISNYPIESQLGTGANWSIDEYNNKDKTFQAIGSKAYYFEVDSESTIYIEESTNGSSWSVLSTISVPSTVTTMTAYKGLITPSVSTNHVRIRFSGSYYYRFVNVALFSQSFSSSDNIPTYQPFVKKTMPSTFKSVDQIVKEDAGIYTKSSMYKWEGKKDLYIDYNFKGKIRIVYKSIPAIVTDLTSDIEIDEVIGLNLLPYFLASHFMLDENPDVAGFCQSRYEELKLDHSKKKSHEETIIDVYGVI